MKRIGIVLACLAAWLWATPASAQFKWGLEAGVNMSKIQVSGDGGLFDSSNRTGWFVGPKAQVVMPVIGLGIDASILYSQKYMKLESDGESSPNKSLPYLEIPINLRYNYGFSSLVGIYLATGPQYNWYMGGRGLDFGDVSGSLERSTFSWNVGAGVNLLSHLQIGLTYNIAMGETGQIRSVDGVVEAFDMRNNTWQVRLAYLF